ncbi:MAG: tetratricopeptide repeat protein [Desulfuromonadales bacterium]|nr:tetratricopeptide repeat protein [Desulfuromonadales bacterium]
MQQQSASFWADIKHFEERLAQDPDSYLFAQLADVYLKVNLVDDALHTAKQGAKKFPTYVAGQRALAMACHAKGLVEECRQALEIVTAALPEDAEAQKMLARLMVSSGELDSAKKVFRVLLEFYPENAEFQEELDLLAQPVHLPDEVDRDTEHAEIASDLQLPCAETGFLEDEIIELTEDDIWVEELEAPVDAAPVQHDPLSTATLAELYVQQGFISKALDIYRALLNEDPANSEVQSRIAELEEKEKPPVICETLPVSNAPGPAFTVPETSSLPDDVPVQGRADAAIITLEGWLDTIRRIKACR